MSGFQTIVLGLMLHCCIILFIFSWTDFVSNVESHILLLSELILLVIGAIICYINVISRYLHLSSPYYWMFLMRMSW